MTRVMPVRHYESMESMAGASYAVATRIIRDAVKAVEERQDYDDVVMVGVLHDKYSNSGGDPLRTGYSGAVVVYKEHAEALVQELSRNPDILSVWLSPAEGIRSNLAIKVFDRNTSNTFQDAMNRVLSYEG